MRNLRAEWTTLPGDLQARRVEGSDIVEINVSLVPPRAEGRVLAMFEHFAAGRGELASSITRRARLASVPDLPSDHLGLSDFAPDLTGMPVEAAAGAGMRIARDAG